jgi:hypothetical protein
MKADKSTHDILLDAIRSCNNDKDGWIPFSTFAITDPAIYILT